MSTSTDLLKQGYVHMKGQLGAWQKRWVVLRNKSSRAPSRIEKYKTESSARENEDCKVILFKNVKDVSRLPSDVRKYALCIFFTDGKSCQFSGHSELEADEWVELIRMLLEGGAVAPRSNSISNPVKETSSQNPDLLTTKMRSLEVADYCQACCIQSPLPELRGECLLKVSAESLFMLHALPPHEKLACWPLNTLRRYGRDRNKFSLEAGRRCETGEGLFVFATPQAGEIYQHMQSVTSALVKSHATLKKQMSKDGLLNDSNNLSSSGSSPVQMD